MTRVSSRDIPQRANARVRPYIIKDIFDGYDFNFAPT
jgi:hypothetical protein